jgi:hypothetical protein
MRLFARRRLNWTGSILTLVAAAVMFTGRHSQAAFLLEFRNSEGGTISVLTMAESSTLELDVYLTATGADLDTLRAEGLFSAGVGLWYDDPVGIATVSDMRVNAAFVNLIPPLWSSDEWAGFTGDVGFGDFLSPNSSFGGIYLGSFFLTALTRGTTTLRLGDRIADFDETLTGDGTVLDGLLDGSEVRLTVTAAAVPEASSLVLALTGGLFVAACRVRTLVRRRELG